MDWWFVVAYLAFLLTALNIVLSVPDILPVSAYGCALSADAASIHGFYDVNVSGCVFSVDSVLDVISVPLIGRAVETPAGVVFEYVGG